jgi:S-formylglutathione hydrolase FrmB
MNNTGDTHRYRKDFIYSRSLENNPPGSPVERCLHTYLPPDYFENRDRKYPVIFFLHGYECNNNKLSVYPSAGNKYELIKSLYIDLFNRLDLGAMASYEKFDDLIRQGAIPPFIFVQPDASLHLPHSSDAKDIMTGEVSTKGSFYVDSPFTGNYESYIAEDVISYVDQHYRTEANNKHRALAGSSIGGYGALSISLHRPGLFSAVAALSPANFTLGSLTLKLRVPILTQLLGEKFSAESGDSSWQDILETLDLVFSHRHPLLPTVKCDANGKVVGYDASAAALWQSHDLVNIINSAGNVYQGLQILINCAENDEFELAPEARRLNSALKNNGINSKLEIYSDPRAAMSPHTFGIAYHMLASIEFCLQNIGHQYEMHSP